MPMELSTKRRLLWSFAVFPAYLAASFLGDTRSAGNPYELGLAHGVCSGLIGATFFYPLFLGIQAGVCALIRRLARSRQTGFSPWEFAGTALWCVLMLQAFLHTSDGAYFRRFVSDEVPSSLRGFQSRHYSGFGSIVWAVSFSIDAAEFPKVINRYEYIRESAHESFRGLAGKDDALKLDVPDETTAELYRYFGTDGKPSICIWTNASHDLVFISGSRE